MQPKRIDKSVYGLLRGAGIDRYYCDISEDITYVRDLKRLSDSLGMNWTSQTETGIYEGYWFRQLGGGK